MVRFCGVGLDRCVHCILRLPPSKPSHRKKLQFLKKIFFFVGDRMEPLQFHDWIRGRLLAGPMTPLVGADLMERRFARRFSRKEAGNLLSQHRLVRYKT